MMHSIYCQNAGCRIAMLSRSKEPQISPPYQILHYYKMLLNIKFKLQQNNTTSMPQKESSMRPYMTRQSARRFGRDITNVEAGVRNREQAKAGFVHQCTELVHQCTQLDSQNKIEEQDEIKHQGIVQQVALEHNDQINNISISNSFILIQSCSLPSQRDELSDYKYQLRKFIMLTQNDRHSTVDPNHLDTNNLISNSPIEDYFSYNKCSHGVIHDITLKMRQHLISWIVAVHEILCKKKETLYLAVQVIDEYCTRKYIAQEHYQLLGLSALFLAAKYQEVFTPKLKRYIDASHGTYISCDLLAMEGQILTTIGFNMSRFTTLWHYQHKLYEIEQQSSIEMARSRNHANNTIPNTINNQIAASSTTSLSIKNLGYYVMQLTLIEFPFRLMRSDYLSVCIMYLAHKMRGVRHLKSRYLIADYQLSATTFKAYCLQVLEVYAMRTHKKFSQVNRKYAFLFTEFLELK